MKHYFSQLDLLSCEYDPPTEFDDSQLLRQLYGEQFVAEDTSGKGGIVVLGAHNSGTSMVTRLVMLLGAFAGNFETISIHRHNKLKYYEQFAVSLFHDSFLGKFVDTRFRPYHGQSLDLSPMTAADRAKFDCFAEKQMRDMSRHTPWVMKDPRMALTMPMWQPKIKDLVCVFVHKDPIKNSISLASNSKKSAHTEENGLMSSQRWLDLWGSTMEQGLAGCRGSPTIIFDSKLIIQDVDAALRQLLGLLEGAGVSGLHMPTPEEVQREVKDFIKTGPRTYHLSPVAQARLHLKENPTLDNAPPKMTPRQAALEEAIKQQLVKFGSDGGSVRFESVADDILSLAAALEKEQERRMLFRAEEST